MLGTQENTDQVKYQLGVTYFIQNVQRSTTPYSFCSMLFWLFSLFKKVVIGKLDILIWFYLWANRQKQSSGGALLKRCCYKFCQIHRKTPLLESLFNKGAGPQNCNLIKKGLQQRCFSVNLVEFLRALFS